MSRAARSYAEKQRQLRSSRGERPHLQPTCSRGDLHGDEGERRDGRERQRGRVRREELCGTTTYLARESRGPEVTERQLESLVGAIDVDLDGDEGVWVGGRCRGHGG